MWFYDERGSELFDEITRLDEYYPTRAERAILEAHAGEIARTDRGAHAWSSSARARRTRPGCSSTPWPAGGDLDRFVPFDVSEETLRAAAASIAGEYGLDVRAVVGDFHRHLGLIPRDGRRMVAFLGGTIGNLDPDASGGASSATSARVMDDDEWFLLGTDLVKDARRLVAAYDDARGVTAEFNRNVLRVLNRELGADFDPDAFDHVARWNADRVLDRDAAAVPRAQRVRVEDLGLDRTSPRARSSGPRSRPSSPERASPTSSGGRLRGRGELDRPRG